MLGLKGTFLLAMVLGAAAVFAAAAMSSRPRHAPIETAAASVQARKLSGQIWVTEQIEPSQLADLRRQGFRAVIDLRPDGEAPGQPSSDLMAHAAHDAGLGFAYVPVPHGEIPTQAVASLSDALHTADAPILLYCRSGKRAARTWALSEASRPGGMAADAIKDAVRAAGQPVDDLDADIAARVAARSPAY